MRIADLEKLKEIRQSVIDRMGQTFAALHKIDDPVEFFRRARFGAHGTNPTNGEPLHLIEQVNQSYHSLVVVAAVEHLYRLGKGFPFEVNLSATSGPDIKSTDGSLVAECFAAVDVHNNGKLKKDIQKALRHEATDRFVFFYSPGTTAAERTEDGVRCVPLSETDLFAV